MQKLSGKVIAAAAGLAVLLGTAQAGYAGKTISNDLSQCGEGKGPAILVTLRGMKAGGGAVRLQNYPATGAAWLVKDKWLQRVEVKAAKGTMQLCVPVGAAGKYAIAVRHDLNNNNDTDIWEDGGGFSNNPAISLTNLGKPGVEKAAFSVGKGITKITINMQYLTQ
jgi:uncharacterized protein (DUF2141 family)